MTEVEFTSLWRKSIGELESIYQSHQDDRVFLLELRKVLDDRDTKKAKELNGKVVARLRFFDGIASGWAAAEASKAPRYRRSTLVAIFCLASVAILEGILRGLGMQLWEPIWRAIHGASRWFGFV